jgi:hypothetical protein
MPKAQPLWGCPLTKLVKNFWLIENQGNNNHFDFSPVELLE